MGDGGVERGSGDGELVLRTAGLRMRVSVRKNGMVGVSVGDPFEGLLEALTTFLSADLVSAVLVIILLKVARHSLRLVIRQTRQITILSVGGFYISLFYVFFNSLLENQHRLYLKFYIPRAGSLFDGTFIYIFLHLRR